MSPRTLARPPATADPHTRHPPPAPEWIETARGVPYFSTASGAAWTPIGQNDAVTWPDFRGLFRRRDIPAVHGHLRFLADHGVTCLRLMLEYCHGENRYFERPVGKYQSNMVRLWDDLFALCAQHGIRVLLTPVDTFWMWMRWGKHPFNRANGGPCRSRSQWLLCDATREALKRRLEFATRRWGGSGTLYAWDLWNEIHVSHGGGSVQAIGDFIDDVGTFLRRLETRLHGRAHLQTVSVFGPHLDDVAGLAEPIFRHPGLDFATTHLYEKGTIDHPRDTVQAAISTGRLVRSALAEIQDQRPYLDSEHGPIHTFKDHRRTLPEPFDDEYFRHMQWAHFASGGAGGGMRWPNRHPHVLTHGMRRAQRSLSEFLPLIDWSRFTRRNLNEEVGVDDARIHPFCCGDAGQAVVWLLRKDGLGRDGMMLRPLEPLDVTLTIPGISPGRFRVTEFETERGRVRSVREVENGTGGAGLVVRVERQQADLALAVRRAGPS
jgi:hypothetical protein